MAPVDGDLRTKGGNSREANSDRPIFVICLRAERHVEPYRALRRGLKILLRLPVAVRWDFRPKANAQALVSPAPHRVGLFVGVRSSTSASEMKDADSSRQPVAFEEAAPRRSFVTNVAHATLGPF
jgi:hypothetical protein